MKYRKIYEDVMKRLDKLENEFLPQVTVDTTEIVFDTIKFNGASTKSLIVANTGQVPVQFGFIKKLKLQKMPFTDDFCGLSLRQPCLFSKILIYRHPL